MRVPSEKKLMGAFRNVDREEAKLVRKFAKAVDDPEALEELVEEHAPSTHTWVQQMYSDPYRSSMWRTSVALHAIGELIGGFGIEALGDKYEYVNMGDTYATTLIYSSDQDRLFIGSWGDFVESEGGFEENPREKNPIRLPREHEGQATFHAKGSDTYVHVWFDQGVAQTDFGHPVPDSGEWQVIVTTSPDPLNIKPRGRELARKTFRYADPRYRNIVASSAQDYVRRALMRRNPTRQSNPAPDMTASALVRKLKF